jgi:hypothetical protein
VYLIILVHATWPTHLYLIILITSGKAYKLRIPSLCSLLQPPTTFSLLGPNILPTTLVLEHPQYVFFP